MNKSIFTRLFVLLCVILMQGAQSWADTDSSTITVNAPTITPGTQTYNGTIVPVITADEGCSIVYVKSTTKDYTTVAEIDKNQGVKTVSSNSVTITDIVGKVGDRHISAYATKTVNGTRYCSSVTNVTYTYAADTKSDITLSASLSGTLSMEQPSQTATISVTASTGTTTITSLTYTYEVSPAGIVEVDANGTVTPKKAGTASINVIFAGNDNYNAASCVIDVNVASGASSTQKVFTSIADIRQASQSVTDDKGSIKNTNCVLKFDNDNPATVIAVMGKSDPDIADKKIINSFFIIDTSNKGLWIPTNDVIVPSTHELAVGSKFTGTLVGTYNQGEGMLPAFAEMKDSKKVTDNGTEYTTTITVDNSGIATDNTPAIYPYTDIEDVQTLANTNNTVTDGNITTSSYGAYLNTIVKLPGTIKSYTTSNNTTEYYLVQAENTETSNKTNRIYFNSSQIDGINLSDYVGTTGVFEGILIKRNNAEPKLVVLKSDFFDISKIYLDENDAEERIIDLVNQGAFDDEVDVYIHRTKLVNTAAWNTLCLPFDMTKDEFKEAFGCELTNLARPTTDTEMTLHQWDGKVSADGVLQFIQLTGDNMKITAGVPYLMKASGTQNVCTQTIKDADTKTPQELMTTDNTYYAHIGQKFINVVPPHEIKATYNNSIVKGDFYFRGLYGRKKYTEDSEGKLTTTLIADGGSQKYQYISTSAGNYLKYLPSGSTLQFNGMRAYFYFPNWDKEANNKMQPSGNTNAKIHIMVIDGEATGIKNIGQANISEKEVLYNLAGQKVDRFYRGIVIKNGKKYLNK